PSAHRHPPPTTTRWRDHHDYAHLNNVDYYTNIDPFVNQYLIRRGALDAERGATIGLGVQTQSNYIAPLGFPQRVEAGLRVARRGSS
ncbi:acyl-CoA thioesterase, partial [Burkholderia pseudomallei]